MENDSAGWDIFIEFPQYSDFRGDFEARPAPIECKFQVKATDRERKSVPITLSNMERLVKTPIPAFILVLEYFGNNSPKNAYIVHVGEELISKVLKRIRELHQSGKELRLNKREISVRYGRQNLLTDMSGIGLKRAIESNVCDGMNDYISRKKHWVNWTGYGESLGSTSFSFKQDDVANFIKMSLGVPGEIDVSDFNFNHTRFGISKPVEVIASLRNVKMVTPEVEPTAIGEIKLYQDKFGPAILFEAKLYVAGMKGVIGTDDLAFRITTNFFELIFDTSGLLSEFHFLTIDARVNIEELRSVSKLVNWLEDGGDLYLKMLFDDCPKLELTSSNNSLTNNVWTNNHEFINDVLFLLDEFDISKTKTFSFIELCKDFQELGRLASFVKKSRAKTEFSFSLNVQLEEEILKEPVRILSAYFVRLDDEFIGVIYSLYGNICAREDCYSVSSNERHIEELVRLNVDSGIREEDIVERINSHSTKYKEHCITCFTSQFFPFLNDMTIQAD